MIDDITQYYTNEAHEIDCHQYKHKPDSEPEILGECHLCGVLLDSNCEIVVDGVNAFCGDRCKGEYKRMVEDGEI